MTSAPAIFPDRSERFSRNWAFITPELQERLRNLTIFAAGVGLSSLIVTLAARTGIGRFILADGDVVETSNLNRQDFTLADIGKNKARAAAQRLKAIDPGLNVDVIPEFLTAKSLVEPVRKSDIVISSLDFESAALFALDREARAAKIPVISPLNLGWGGAALVFDPHGPSLAEFLKIELDEHGAPLPGQQVAQRFVKSALAGELPGYLTPVFEDYVAQGESWPSEPQLGVAASVTAGLVVRATVALCAGEPVHQIPAINRADIRALTEPPMRSAPPKQATAPAASEEAATELLLARQRPLRAHALHIDAASGRGRFERVRGSGLQVRALRHDELTPEQLEVIGSFRLDQYGLFGLYRPQVIVDRGLTSDPALDQLSGDAYHVIALSSEDEILAYSCLRGPNAAKVSWGHGKHKLSNERRPLYPTETELFGRQVFTGLSHFASWRTREVGEITRIMRNKITKSPEVGLAVVNVISMLYKLITSPEMGLKAAIGCAGPEARRMLYELRLPMLYAPHAPVVVKETTEADAYWAPPTSMAGVFWPFVVTSADLRSAHPFLTKVEKILDEPVTQVRAKLQRILARTMPAPPRTLLRRKRQSAHLWTADPFFR